MSGIMRGERDQHSALSNDDRGSNNTGGSLLNVVVPMSEVILGDNPDNESTYTGHLVNTIENLVGSLNGLKEPVCASVRWFTYGLLLSLALLLTIVSAVYVVFISNESIVQTITYAPTVKVGPSATSSYPPTVASSLLPSHSANPSSSSPTSPVTWTQVGFDIEGIRKYENIGEVIAMSSDGGRICVGGNGNLRIFDLIYNSGTSWSMVKDFSSYVTQSMPNESVSISLYDGSHIVFGDVAGEQGGSVFVFYQDNDNGWIQLGDTLFGDKFATKWFGNSAVITGDGGKIVVATSFSGQVYVFEWSKSDKEWTLEYKLIGDVNSRYGRSVSVASDASRIIVGASEDDNNGKYSGSVYIYDISSQSLVQRIDGAKNIPEYFGLRVAISGTGSCLAVSTKNDQVRIYRLDPYDTTKYSLVGRSIVGTIGTNFGNSLSLCTDCKRLAVGAISGSSADLGPDLNGTTFLYSITDVGWNLIGEIVGEAAGDSSGSAVALSGDGNRVAIGARYNDGGGLNSGHVRVYEGIQN